MKVQKFHVGDIVRVIKKIPYKGKTDVEIGDIGIVNYIATTGKCSVHIDGKKNPKDDIQARFFGNKYDFWIPFDCIEVLKADTIATINEDDMIKECLFKDSSALDSLFDTMRSYETIERKEKNMETKKIRNVEVVDMHFKRIRSQIEEQLRIETQNIFAADRNYIFAKTLEEQLEQYVKDNELTNVDVDKFEIKLPLTNESNKACEDLKNKFDKDWSAVEDNKKEILAMLSGCETYEQEMTILKSYGIVSENNTMLF